MIKKYAHILSSLLFLSNIVQISAMDHGAGIALAEENQNKIDDALANAFGTRRGKVEDSFTSEASAAAQDDTPLEDFRLILKGQFSRDDKSETVYFLVGFLQAISRKLDDEQAEFKRRAVTKIMEVGNAFTEQLRRGLFNDKEKIQLYDILKGKKQLVESSPALQNLSAALQSDDAIRGEIEFEKQEALKAEQEKAAQEEARNLRAELFSAINQNGAKTLKSSPGKKSDGTFIEPKVHVNADIEEKPDDRFGASRFIPKGQPESIEESSSLENSWAISSYEQRRYQAEIERALAEHNRQVANEEAAAREKATALEAERKAHDEAEAKRTEREAQKAKLAEQALNAAQPKTPDNQLSGKNPAIAPKPASRVDTPAPKKVVKAKNGKQPAGPAPKASQAGAPSKNSRPLPPAPKAPQDRDEQKRLDAEALRIRLEETKEADAKEMDRLKRLGEVVIVSESNESELTGLFDRENLRERAAEEAREKKEAEDKAQRKVEEAQLAAEKEKERENREALERANEVERLEKAERLQREREEARVAAQRRQEALAQSEAVRKAAEEERARLFRESEDLKKNKRTWLHTLRDLTGITALLGGSAYLYNKYVKKPETEEELKKKRAAQRAKMQEKKAQPQSQLA